MSQGPNLGPWNLSGANLNWFDVEGMSPLKLVAVPCVFTVHGIRSCDQAHCANTGYTFDLSQGLVPFCLPTALLSITSNHFFSKYKFSFFALALTNLKILD